jgi:sentrin-specific protease 1
MDATDWDLEMAKNIPRQENKSDCGVFACSLAECLSRGGELEFAQKDVGSLRRRMVLNIVEKEL